MGKKFLLSVRPLLAFDALPFTLLHPRKMITLFWLLLLGDLTIVLEITVVMMVATVVVAPTNIMVALVVNEVVATVYVGMAKFPALLHP